MSVAQPQSSARHQAITGWLTEQGRVDVVDLATRLGVAQETVRRDLKAMEAAGTLQRVHGGAIRVDAPPLATRPGPRSPDGDHLELAQRVWRDLPRSGSILLGTGALGLALAHTIVTTPPETTGLTVVTNSLDAAIVLSRASRLDVYNIGGSVSPVTRAQEGDWAVTEMQRLHVDVSVVCPAGITLEQGLTQSTPAAAAVSQVEVTCADRVIALASSATLGTAALVQFARIDQVDQIAVAGSINPGALQPFVDRGVSVSSARSLS